MMLLDGRIALGSMAMWPCWTWEGNGGCLQGLQTVLCPTDLRPYEGPFQAAVPLIPHERTKCVIGRIEQYEAAEWKGRGSARS